MVVLVHDSSALCDAMWRVVVKGSDGSREKGFYWAAEFVSDVITSLSLHNNEQSCSLRLPEVGY